MNRLGIFVITGILFFYGIAVGEETEIRPTITIGAFNLQRLGEADRPFPNDQRVKNIAAICKGVDLLAVEEVAEFGTGLEELAATMGSEYNYAVSDVTTHERLGIIWRSPVELIEPCGFLEDLVLGKRPFSGVFRAGNFDFRVVVFHLFWDGTKKTYPHSRNAELKLLDDWLCHRTDKELDLLLMGDFNEPNYYYDYRIPPQFTSHYDFYQLLARHHLMSVSLTLRKPTSIANQNIYDHIMFNPNHYFTEEFAGMERVRVPEWEVEYDVNKNGRIDYSEHTQASLEVTDHRPVFASFYIDMEDDDE